MATIKITWGDLFQKLMGGMLVGMFGLVIGYFAGGIFESMGSNSFSILKTLPWQEFLTFLGAISGFILGTQITE